MKGGQRGPSAPKAGSDKAHWQAKTPAQDNRRGRRIMTESLPRKREGPARVAGRRGGQSGASSSGLQGLCIRRECCAMAAVDTECPLKRYEGSNSVAQKDRTVWPRNAPDWTATRDIYGHRSEEFHWFLVEEDLKIIDKIPLRIVCSSWYT